MNKIQNWKYAQIKKRLIGFDNLFNCFIEPNLLKTKFYIKSIKTPTDKPIVNREVFRKPA